MIETRLPNPEPSANSFYANGVKYIIYGDDIAIQPFEAFERIQLELKTGSGIDKIYKSLNDIWADLEAAKHGSAAVKVYDLLTAGQRIANDEKHPGLMLCTCFIMPEDHDRRTWDKAKAIEWVNDWSVEGIGVNFFIRLARHFAQTFTGDLNTDTPDTLAGQE
jgi:hypothetical protein